MANENTTNTSVASGSKRMVGKNLPFEVSEAYKLLRTNVLFSMADEKGCKIIGVTSSLKGEGKSTTSVNLAYELAEAEKKVLLIEADMRLPAALKILRIKKKVGLSHVLAGIYDLEVAIAKSVLLENLDVLPAGKIPPNPSEMLASEKMGEILKTLSEQYEYIIVDLPPVLAVSDGLTVSKYVSGMVIVIRENYCDQKSLAETMRQMQFLNVKVVGFVMNNVDNKGKGYYKRTGKYKKGYSYSYNNAVGDNQ